MYRTATGSERRQDAHDQQRAEEAREAAALKRAGGALTPEVHTVLLFACCFGLAPRLWSLFSSLPDAGWKVHEVHTGERTGGRTSLGAMASCQRRRSMLCSWGKRL